MGLKSFEHRVCGVTRLPQPDQCLRKVEAFTFFPLRIARTVLRSRPYRSCSKPLSPGTLYFHAQYRQATPAHSWISDWSSNGDPKVNYRPNLSGEDNYVWLEARGQGHFVGVTMPILQNQDGWWGEGDDLFFIDGESRPSINGTGFEDYFLDAWGFGSHSFGYGLYGAPVKGSEQVNGRASVYRFHLDSPIPFTKSLRATIEHGHANHRSDNLFSVAYWYQSEPHAPFPSLPPVNDRVPRLFPVTTLRDRDIFDAKYSLNGRIVHGQLAIKALAGASVDEVSEETSRDFALLAAIKLD